MPDPQIQLDSHAQQANGPYVHLVKWALEKYELFKSSALRAKKLKEAEECRKVYAQEAAAVVGAMGRGQQHRSTVDDDHD